MPLKRYDCLFYLAVCLLILSTAAIAVNHFIYHYPGNNYFPEQTQAIFLSLVLMYIGFILMLGLDHLVTKLVLEVFYFFLVFSLLALATNATQLTPFETIDQYIVQLEGCAGINEAAITKWTQLTPVLYHLLSFIYDSLPYQMCYIPLFIIATQQVALSREYYFLLLFSALLGFTFYYFFPTTGPASLFKSPFFTTAQLATGLKFTDIHHHLQPSTIEGGLIALPSFHVIWAWFCLYILRNWSLIFYVMLPFNLLLISACVLIGWHYPTDIVGALIIILLSHMAYNACQR